METGNKDKKIGVIAYEFIGTAFIMYAMMMFNGLYAPTMGMTCAMTALAWNVSGGHFNPALTIGMYVAEKDFGGNALIAGLMIAAQFCGAFFGVLLGFLALIDKDWQEEVANFEMPFDTPDVKANVPFQWFGTIMP